MQTWGSEGVEAAELSSGARVRKEESRGMRRRREPRRPLDGLLLLPPVLSPANTEGGLSCKPGQGSSHLRLPCGKEGAVEGVALQQGGAAGALGYLGERLLSLRG